MNGIEKIPSGGGEKVNKKFLSVLLATVILTMTISPLITNVMAKKPVVNDGDGYTEYVGSLGGANFYVLIPDDWTNEVLGDGILVVSCRGASMDDLRSGLTYMQNLGLAQNGIAVAASDYGSKELTRKFGVIRTHQLTEYVIDNFGVSGKVFLWGESLGGSISLVLGAQYPNVYSGVLDVSGIKDWAMEYDHGLELVESTDPVLWIFGSNLVDVNLTPEEKPQSYAKYSATSYTDLSIPVISLIHYNDQIVPPEQTTYYHSLVGGIWHKVVTVIVDTPGPYPVIGGIPLSSWYGHFDPLMSAVLPPTYFELLVQWSNGDIAASDIPPTFP